MPAEGQQQLAGGVGAVGIAPSAGFSSVSYKQRDPALVLKLGSQTTRCTEVNLSAMAGKQSSWACSCKLMHLSFAPRHQHLSSADVAGSCRSTLDTSLSASCATHGAVPGIDSSALLRCNTVVC